jgi:hypothetical protein
VLGLLVRSLLFFFFDSTGMKPTRFKAVSRMTLTKCWWVIGFAFAVLSILVFVGMTEQLRLEQNQRETQVSRHAEEAAVEWSEDLGFQEKNVIIYYCNRNILLFGLHLFLRHYYLEKSIGSCVGCESKYSRPIRFCHPTKVQSCLCNIVRVQ